MLSGVIVSEGPKYPFDRNPDMLISSVIFYVNTVVRSGGFPYAQFPRDAARLYWMDFYVAQVRNGGHSQYIYNSELTLIALSCAREGLAEAGMTPLVQVFDDFLTWLKNNCERAQEETGFGPVIHELDAFNKRLYDFGSHAYSKSVAAWIMGWPGLRVVTPDDQVLSIERAIEDAYRRHPDHLWRRHWARAATLGKPHHQLSVAQTLCAHARPAIQYEGMGIPDAGQGAQPGRLGRLVNKVRSHVNTAIGRRTFPEDLRHALDPYRMEATRRGRLNFSPIRTSAGYCGVCAGSTYALVSYKGKSVGRILARIPSKELGAMQWALGSQTTLAAIHLCHQLDLDASIRYVAHGGHGSAEGSWVLRIATAPMKDLVMNVYPDRVELFEAGRSRAQMTMDELRTLFLSYEAKAMAVFSSQAISFYDAATASA